MSFISSNVGYCLWNQYTAYHRSTTLFEICLHVAFYSDLASTRKTACKSGIVHTTDACKTVNKHTFQHNMKYCEKHVALNLSYCRLTCLLNYVNKSWFNGIISTNRLNQYQKHLWSGFNKITTIVTKSLKLDCTALFWITYLVSTR